VCFVGKKSLIAVLVAHNFGYDLPRRAINFMSRMFFLTLTSRVVPKYLLIQKMSRVPDIFAGQRLLYI
jgi:hypothetical protein